MKVVDFSCLDSPPNDKHLLFNKISELKLILVFGSQFKAPESAQGVFEIIQKLTYIITTGEHKLRDWFQLQFSKIPANLQTRFSIADSPSSLATSCATGAAALVLMRMSEEIAGLKSVKSHP